MGGAEKLTCVEHPIGQRKNTAVILAEINAIVTVVSGILEQVGKYKRMIIPSDKQATIKVLNNNNG